MTKDQNIESTSIISELPARMEAVEAEAMRGCGLSDVLYEARTQAGYASILESASNAEKPRVEAMLRDRGFNPDFIPYEAGEGECGLTGIDIDCCPCGNHP